MYNAYHPLLLNSNGQHLVPIATARVLFRYLTIALHPTSCAQSGEKHNMLAEPNTSLLLFTTLLEKLHTRPYCKS